MKLRNQPSESLIRATTLIGMICSAIACYAAAGIADEYSERQHWMFPAYAYCLGFGILLMLMMIFASSKWESKINEKINQLSSYLKKHNILAILFLGILWSVPLGITIQLLWDTIWFLAFFPVIAFFVMFPIILSKNKIRKNWLLNPSWLRWIIMIVIASALSSLLFILLSDNNLLPYTDTVYVGRSPRTTTYMKYYSHPYASMALIWVNYFYFAFEILIAISIYCIGLTPRFVNDRVRSIMNNEHDADITL